MRRVPYSLHYGEGCVIKGSTSRIAAIANLLKRRPSLRVHLDGHTGVSAPPEIAGWGSTVAIRAEKSSHPNAEATKAGYGWVEIFMQDWQISDEGRGDERMVMEEVPPRPDYYPADEENEERSYPSR